jgi:FkbM family methyltransferase
MFDWLRLSASSALTPTHQIAVPYIDGAILHWPAQATSALLCARYGLGEYADMAFCLHLLRPTDLFCDIGANAGVYTILAARAVGASVFAAEPVPRTFDLLMQNVYANGVSDRVEAKQIGIGREPCRLHFTPSLWSWNHVTAPGEGTIAVDVETLDSTLLGRVPTAIKIDVEGFEAEVIAGASRILSSEQLQAVIVELADSHMARYKAGRGDVVSALLASGLSGPYWYDPTCRSLIEAGRPDRRKYNQIFIRDKDLVAERLRTSKSYTVHGTIV